MAGGRGPGPASVTHDSWEGEYTFFLLFVTDVFLGSTCL